MSKRPSLALVISQWLFLSLSLNQVLAQNIKALCKGMPAYDILPHRSLNCAEPCKYTEPQSGVTRKQCAKACVKDPKCKCATFNNRHKVCRFKSEACLNPKSKLTPFNEKDKTDVIQPCSRMERRDGSKPWWTNSNNAGGGSGPAPAPAPSYSDEQYSVKPGGLTGNAITTRFWDCAKPSCGWYGKADVSAPARSCAIDGVTPISPSTSPAFACSNFQPWVSKSDPNKSFGFVAFASHQGEARSCCICLEVTFTSTLIAGKKFVVQAININGGGLSTAEYVEMQIPGGGIGLVNNCKAQYNAGPEWGELFGGLGAENTCYNLPQALQPGCNWQFDWLKDAPRPTVSYVEITCPKVLTDKSGCIRKDV